MGLNNPLWEQTRNAASQVMVLYAPRSPDDARVAEIVHDDLIISIVRECFFGLFTLAFVGSGVPILGRSLLAWWKKHEEAQAS